MKKENLKTADVVGRWVYYRRAYGFRGAELLRGFIQDAHPGEIVGMIHGTHSSAKDYPRRPLPTPAPLLLPLDELEIHAIVEPVATPAGEEGHGK